MNYKELEDDIASIKTLMERSSKFISLSGLSGILAGCYALAGTLIAYFLLKNQYSAGVRVERMDSPGLILRLFLVALSVLLLSILTGIFLTVRKSIRTQQSIWNPVSRNLFYSMVVPLVSGGVFILILAFHGYHGLIAPSCLIFYGLALFGASSFTFNDVKYLGITEIFLGLLASMFPGYGLWFWAFGFGVLHIVYGSIMHFKYDR